MATDLVPRRWPACPGSTRGRHQAAKRDGLKWRDGRARFVLVVDVLKGPRGAFSPLSSQPDRVEDETAQEEGRHSRPAPARQPGDQERQGIVAQNSAAACQKRGERENAAPSAHRPGRRAPLPAERNLLFQVHYSEAMRSLGRCPAGCSLRPRECPALPCPGRPLANPSTPNNYVRQNGQDEPPTPLGLFRAKFPACSVFSDS